MKKRFFLVCTFLLLLTVALSAMSVSYNQAEHTARMKLQVESKNDFIIKDFYELKGDDNDILAYVFQLDPQGFIIVTTDTDIAPILGYSFLNNYEKVEEGEWTLGNHYVTQDLSLRYEAIPFTSLDVLTQNNMLWKKYENQDVEYFTSKAKGRDIYPPTGTTSTGGWIDQLWNQSYPYNMYCPIDPQNSGRSVVGCVATALAMIINYHRYIGDASFSDADDYVSDRTTPPIYVDNDHNSLDFLSFPELNILLDQLRGFYQTNTPLDNQMKAVLSVACGFAVEMNYSSDASGAYCATARTALLNKFGFDTASYYYSSHPNFYSQMQQDMVDAKPCELGISGAGGHAINVDGYNTAEDTYHLNFGWGGSSNGWYSLPGGMPSGFTIVDNAVLNIQGGIYPFLEYDGMFASDISGDHDGNINPGETAQVRIRLANKQSFSTATSVVATLETTDPRATVTDPNATYNDIPASSSQLNLLDPFEVEFAQGIGVCSIPFTLHVTSNDGYYADLDFEIDVTLDLAGWPVLITNGVPGSPAIADLNNADNGLELACGDKNGEVHLYNESGTQLGGFPYNTGHQIYGSVAVANLDTDNDLEIVVASRANKVVALNPDGSTLFEYTNINNMLCTPVVADINNDGVNEVIVQDITRKLYVIKPDGELYGNFPVDIPNFMYSGVGAAVADLDSSGTKEMLIPCNDGILYCVNEAGSIAWQTTLSAAPHGPATIVRFGKDLYILVGTADGTLTKLDNEGTIIDEFTLNGDIRTSPVAINPANSSVIDDLVIIVGTNSEKLYAIDWNGNNLSGFPYDLPDDVESTPVIADIDGNGYYDIIFGCNDGYLYGIDLTGETVPEFPIYLGYDIASSPQIADMDNDGDYDIAVGTNAGMWIIDYKTPYGDGDMLCSIYRYDLARTGLTDCTPIVGVGDQPHIYDYFITQNFPNPVANQTNISFGLPNMQIQNPKMRIYNLLGQLVSSYDIENPRVGENTFVWNGKDNNGKNIPNGVYFYRLETDTYQSDIKKLILLK